MHALSAFLCMFVLFRKMMMVVVAVAVAVAAVAAHAWMGIHSPDCAHICVACDSDGSDGGRERDGAKAKCIAQSPSLVCVDLCHSSLAPSLPLSLTTHSI